MRWHSRTYVRMYLPYEREAESERIARARLSLDHPAHNVCVLYLAVTLVALVDRRFYVRAPAPDSRFLGPLARNQLPGGVRQLNVPVSRSFSIRMIDLSCRRQLSTLVIFAPILANLLSSNIQNSCIH